MSYQSDNFFNVWITLVEQLDPNELEEVAITLRGVWTRRNEVLHGKSFTHPTVLLQKAKADMAFVQETNYTSQTPSMQFSQRVHKWLKPVEGFFKINWDATLNVGIGKIGMGVIIRDHNGQVRGTLRASRWLKGNPFDAEAYDLLLDAIFCKEMGLKQVLLEGDSKQVVDLLQNHVLNWSIGGLLIKDARSIMNSCSKWSANHAYREANKAAHFLAKFTLNLSDDVYDIEECLFGMQSIVNIEML